MKSPVADMKNTGSRYGGSITAALFLKQYVKDEIEWAHMDMAGGCTNGVGGREGGRRRKESSQKTKGECSCSFQTACFLSSACSASSRSHRRSPLTPAASFDFIASGPVWDEKAGLPTGFGAATLAEWVNIRAA